MDSGSESVSVIDAELLLETFYDKPGLVTNNETSFISFATKK